MQRKISLERIKFSITSQQGLDAAEVAARKTQYGNNDIVEVQTNRWLKLMHETARDPMIWFLIGVGILFLTLKNYNESIILFLATIPLVIMDIFLQCLYRLVNG